MLNSQSARDIRSWDGGRVLPRPPPQLLLGGAFRVSLVGGCASNLGVLLSLRRVLVALHVVVLAVKLGGGAMRLGCALVVLGCFCVGLVGHLYLPWSGTFPVVH
jgi:hypothetical protein